MGEKMKDQAFCKRMKIMSSDKYNVDESKRIADVPSQHFRKLQLD